MADIKISALTAASALDGTEVAPVVQSATTKKALVSAIGTYVRGLFTTTPATLAEGGTGAASAAAARTSLGVVAAPASSSDGFSYVVRNGVVKPYFIFSGYVANVWEQPDFSLTPATGSATAAGTIYFSPLVIYEKVTISTVGITVSVAGSNCNIAIYPSDPTSKRPLVAAAPLASTGSFAIGSATTFTPALTTPVTLDPGLYWMAHNTDAVATINCQTSTQVWAMNYTGASTGGIAASTANGGKYHFELVGAFASGWPTSGTPTEVAGTTHAAIITFMPSIVY